MKGKTLLVLFSALSGLSTAGYAYHYPLLISQDCLKLIQSHGGLKIRSEYTGKHAKKPKFNGQPFKKGAEYSINMTKNNISLLATHSYYTPHLQFLLFMPNQLNLATVMIRNKAYEYGTIKYIKTQQEKDIQLLYPNSSVKFSILIDPDTHYKYKYTDTIKIRCIAQL